MTPTLRATLPAVELLLWTDHGRPRACWCWRGALLAWVVVAWC